MAYRSIGVDGCRAGWVAAVIEGGGSAPRGEELTKVLATVTVYPTIETVWKSLGPSDRLLLIDIPVGFAVDAGGTRECDRLARQWLGGARASSVFPCPTREALGAASYLDACDVNERLIGKRLSRQSWGIGPKIREVDVFLRSSEDARSRTREVHPEVLFWALNGRRSMVTRKTTRAGLQERLIVLERFVPNVRQVLANAVDRTPASHAAPDDILDALAAAVTGRFGGDSLRSIPDEPPVDAHGLRTQMVYWLSGNGDGSDEAVADAKLGAGIRRVHKIAAPYIA